MKSIISMLLGIMLLLTLSEAMSLPTSATQEIGKIEAHQPPTDKRYALFDFIATTIHKHFSHKWKKELTYELESLQALDSFYDNHKDDEDYDSQSHQDIKRGVAGANRVVQNVIKDETNCALQREAFKTVNAIHIDIDWITFAGVESIIDLLPVNREQTTIDIREDFRKVSQELFDQLPEVIESFVESLDDGEKEQYAKLLEWCRGFLAAENNEQKMISLQKFDFIYWKALKTTNYADMGDKTACKWYPTRFLQFLSDMTMFVRGEM